MMWYCYYELKVYGGVPYYIQAISQENIAVLTSHAAPVATTSPKKMRDDLVMDDGWVYVEGLSPICSSPLFFFLLYSGCILF